MEKENLYAEEIKKSITDSFNINVENSQQLKTAKALFGCLSIEKFLKELEKNGNKVNLFVINIFSKISIAKR